MCYSVGMNIPDIINAFGTDERLPFAELAERLSLPRTREAQMRFARGARSIGVRKTRQRFGGRVRWCYNASHFRLIQKQGRALTPEQLEPSFGSWEVLRMNLKAKTAILAYRDSEMAKLRKANAGLTAELRRMRRLLLRFGRAAAAMAVGITPMQSTESVARAL